MTGLLIGYPDVQFNALSASWITGTEDSEYPLANATSGSRSEFVRSASTVGTAEIQFDLGAAATASAEYLFVAGANLSKSLGAQRMLLNGWNGVSATSICGLDTTLQSAGIFSGPRSEDFLSASSFNDSLGGTIPSANYRYFRVRIGNGSTNEKWAFRKLMLGRFLDFGRDPLYPLPHEIQVLRSSWRAPRYKFTLNWKGITDAQRIDFMDKIVSRMDYQSLVLFDKDNLILNGFRTLHCALIGYEFNTTYPNNNSLEAEFEEVL